MNALVHTRPQEQSTVGSSVILSLGSLPSAVSDASGTSSLAPPPSPAGLDNVQDGMSMMYSLVAAQGDQGAVTAENGVSSATRAEQAEQVVQENALKQQEADEAKMETGSLWGSICHVFNDLGANLEQGRVGDALTDSVSDTVNMLDSPHLLAQLEALAPQVAEYAGIAAAVVGAGVLTAASGGAGGIAVAAAVVALSAAGMFAEKTGCFGKDSTYIGLGLEVGGAVLSFGASSAMVASTALTSVSAAVDGVSGASDVLAGASAIAVGQQQSAILDDTADVQQVTVALNHNTRLVNDLISGMKNAQQSNTAALHAIAGAAQTYGQTLSLASAAKA